MAGSLNQCTFVGNVGKDPEIKSFSNGGKIANFSIAVSETWKDRESGEKKERTEWINVAVKSEGLVGIVERYVKKGSKLLVQGKFQTRKWQDQGGNDRYSTEIVLQGYDAVVLLLDGKQSDDGQQRQGSDRGSSGGSSFGGGSQQGNGAGGRRATFDSDLDDDVPFCTPFGAW